MQKIHPNVEKATSNFLFFFIGHKNSSMTSGRSCNKRSGAGLLFPVLSGVYGDFQHGKRFKRRAGLPL
jgi:hypothetical protein